MIIDKIERLANGNTLFYSGATFVNWAGPAATAQPAKLNISGAVEIFKSSYTVPIVTLLIDQSITYITPDTGTNIYSYSTVEAILLELATNFFFDVVAAEIIGGYESGSEQWLSGQNYPQGTSGIAITGGTICYIPIYAEFDAVITDVEIRAGSNLGNAGTMVTGLYDFNNGVGGGLIAQPPTIGDTAITLQTFTFTDPVELNKGYYFWCFWASADYNLGGRNGGISILGSDQVNTQYKFKTKTLAYSTTLPATVEEGTAYSSVAYTPRAAWFIQ